jgi:multicomponent Na+:H+ antiporter subunit F
MKTFFDLSGLLLLLLMIPLLYRVWAGPTTMDRMVAANTIGTKTTVMLLLIGILFGRLDMFVDFALTYALLNFIGSLAVSWYFQRQSLYRQATTTQAPDPGQP